MSVKPSIEINRTCCTEIGGVLLSTEIEDYVVITPEMVIGVL